MLKKAVMRLVQEDMIAEMRSKGIPIHHRTARGAELKKVFSEGGVPLVLISSYAIYGEKIRIGLSPTVMMKNMSMCMTRTWIQKQGRPLSIHSTCPSPGKILIRWPAMAAPV